MSRKKYEFESESDLSDEEVIESDSSSFEDFESDSEDSSNIRSQRVKRSKFDKNEDGIKNIWLAAKKTHKLQVNSCVLGDMRCNFQLSEDAEELEFWEKYWDREVEDLIVYQSNLFRVQNEFFRIKPFDVNELRVWLGITMLRGYHFLPNLKSYWSLSPDLEVPLVRKAMTRER